MYIHQHSGYIQSAMSSCMLRITCTQVFYACSLMMCACYNIDKTTNIQSMIISNNICFSFMVYVKTRVFTSSSKHEESWDDELFGSWWQEADWHDKFPGFASTMRSGICCDGLSWAACSRDKNGTLNYYHTLWHRYINLLGSYISTQLLKRLT